MLATKQNKKCPVLQANESMISLFSFVVSNQLYLNPCNSTFPDEKRDEK
jgi:hypothetical protein